MIYTVSIDEISVYLLDILIQYIVTNIYIGGCMMSPMTELHGLTLLFCSSYIFSLALADLLVILICVPFVSVIYTLESWPWGELICRISEAAKDVSIGVSVFTLTALSAERYCAIVNPFRKLQVCFFNHVHTINTIT